MNIQQLKNDLANNKYDVLLQSLYVSQDSSNQKQRYLKLIDEFARHFKEEDMMIISAPGRSEVGGNHTDHQNGRVLAASVNLDMVAMVAPTVENQIIVISEGFSIAPVDLSDLSINEDEKYTSESLIRGVAARFVALGYKIGGFHACMNSSVLKGSGISSSAAFEVLIGNIFSHLYNQGEVDAITIAQVGQYAENVYFDKPCGLMDQMASSVGGFVYIDFKDSSHPHVEKVNFDFKQSGLILCLVDTKGSHADLSDEYGLMPKEMKEVAHYFHKEVLSELCLNDVLCHLSELKEVVSDRCLLRSIHFFNENDRVLKQVEALRNKDTETFKELIIESGYSSYMYLQNVYSPHNVQEQGISIALAVSEQILKGKGAYRVHGGGLAGTIQAFVPSECLDEYIEKMEALFKKGACHCLAIRNEGGIRVI